MTEQEKLMKMLAMEESLKKSRAMIFYTSDRIWLLPPRGWYQKTEEATSSPSQNKPISSMRNHNTIRDTPLDISASRCNSVGTSIL